MRSIDIIGKRFGLLTVEEYSFSKGYTHYYNCKCDCGNETTVVKGNLLRGNQVSCGCYRKNLLADRNRLPENYLQLGKIFRNMKRRCYDNNNIRYSRYGERGIRICDEWMDNIDSFRSWAVSNGYKPGLTIDRINNDGDYCPENCRWIEPQEQLNNYSKNVFIEYNGKRQTLAQWSRELGMPTSTLHNRIRVHHWDIERALSTPVRKR